MAVVRLIVSARCTSDSGLQGALANSSKQIHSRGPASQLLAAGALEAWALFLLQHASWLPPCGSLCHLNSRAFSTAAGTSLSPNLPTLKRPHASLDVGLQTTATSLVLTEDRLQDPCGGLHRTILGIRYPTPLATSAVRF